MGSNEPVARTGGINKKYTLLTLLIAGIVAVLCVAFIKLFERERPDMAFLDDVSLLGPNSTIHFTVIDGRSGIREITVLLKQGEKSSVIYDKSFQRRNILFNGGPEKLEDNVTVNIKSLAYQDGPAELEIFSRDFSWWNWQAGNEARETYPVTIDTKPPGVAIIYSPRYISPGGSGIVVYRTNEDTENHGVFINGSFHPGFPVTQPSDGRFVAYIGLPYHLEKFDQAQVIAKDRTGNQGQAPFVMILKKTRFVKDRITLSQNFLNLKLPEFSQNYTELQGDPVEQYLYINNTIRQDNSRTIRQACSNSQPQQLWEGRFMRMGRSSRRAGFADQRTYYFEGKEIDQQVHLGIDLASTSRTPILAANRGQVVFADYLGIYGNTVILDHGQGVFSLYAHLSRIDVMLNDIIEKNNRLGLSGTSGMAGGDHLHFSMLVNGVFVNPLEWWDEQWLKLNIIEQL
jgi:murein DD-endopeptidase MepM/ murein hydrolase activator NlpD